MASHFHASLDQAAELIDGHVEALCESGLILRDVAAEELLDDVP